MGIISSTYTGPIYDDTATTTETTGVETGMGQEAFLKMFLAQVTNQNPLDPMDNTEFTAQLAQFSSLEQLQLINENLGSLSTLETVMNRTSALSYLGKEVIFSGGAVPVVDGVAGKVTFDLESDAAELRATIYDANGDLVADLDAGAMEAGSNTFQWDGTDYDGDKVEDGAYVIRLTAYDSDGQTVSISNKLIRATVTGYQVGDDGKDYLLIGDTALGLNDVLAVNATTTTTTTSTSNNSTKDLVDYLNSLTSDESDTADLEEGSMSDFLNALVTAGSLAAALL